MEKARLDHISRLLEITGRERNHKLLLSVRNLVGAGHLSFPIHNARSSPSTTRRAFEGRAFRPRRSRDANTGELFASFRSKTSCSSRLPTLVCARSQAYLVAFSWARFTTCPPCDEEEEKEAQTRKGCLCKIGRVRRLYGSDSHRVN